MTSSLDPSALDTAIGPATRWSPIVVADRTGSTNADLLEQVRTGAVGPGAVLIAAEQVSGRGRLTRSWSSPPAASVAVSAAVLCPTTLPVTILPLVAGLAVAQAVRDLGAPAQLKWPNDVLIGERKCCGILVETTRPPAPHSTSRTQPVVRAIALEAPLVAVIGIGLNISQTRDQLPVDTATSLALEGVQASRETVVGTVLRRLDALVTDWLSGGDILPSYRAWSATLGRRVAITLGDSVVHGQAADVAQDGRLGVIIDGNFRYFAAGDVEQLRATGPTVA
jgi:BirA family biotin operon repressor/biotin-[acetyl-CoA-carboxylase] ligase